MGDWCVTTVRIGKIEPLPNSDTLSITQVFGGYPVIFKTGELKEGDLATYVAVDTLVPVAHEFFKFLDSGKGRTHERVKAKKLRGTFSQGLLVPWVIGSVEGEDVAEALGCLKYLPPAEQEPTAPSNKSNRAARRSETAAFDRRIWTATGLIGVLATLLAHGFWCLTWLPLLPIAYGVIKYNRWLNKKPHYGIYDIEAWRHYSDLFQEGDDVVMTLKIHGANASYHHNGRRFFMKSRTTFRGSSGGKGGWAGTGEFSFDDVWKKIAVQYDLERKLRRYPELVLFGEIYGHKIQDLTYDCVPGEQKFAAFDLFNIKTHEWLDYDSFVDVCNELQIPIAPVLYRGAWTSSLIQLAEGPDPIGKTHVREGWVCRPVIERRVPQIGRLQLKLAGQGYLLRKQPEEEKAA